MKILIKNGRIITSSQSSKSDILVTDSQITAIAPEISSEWPDKTIDASGCYIFPGGVDPNVHLHLPDPSGFSSDDFLSGSIAALFGGTTTILDFVTPAKGESLTDALTNRMTEAEPCLADYSFHASLMQWSDNLESEIDSCIDKGISSFMVYMARKDRVGLNEDDLYKIMKLIGQKGKKLLIHCESGEEIEELREKYFRKKRIEPKYHALSRPSKYEARAVKKAINLAEKAECPLYLVNISSQESLEYIEDALYRDQPVFAETCPQYLLLNESRYEGEFEDTAPYVMSPPLRKKTDNIALWNAVTKGSITSIGSDHCPYMMSQKLAGKTDFRLIPSGAGGIEHRMELLYSFGVLGVRISINKMVELYSTQPAKIFGLYPAKGEIRVGSDADIVVWKPGQENFISAQSHHQNCDFNIYEGFRTSGSIRNVLVGGKVMIENGKLVDYPEKGKFIKR
jgi:dihydropyrimidinase